MSSFQQKIIKHSKKQESITHTLGVGMGAGKQMGAGLLHESKQESS